jgi:hypothetical protein
MEPNQAFLCPSTPVAPPVKVIQVPQVWRNLAPEQQTQLLQAIVLVCQEVVWPLPPVQESEVADD